MRKQLFLGVVAALGLCSSSAWATKTNYRATLDGTLATPENNATGSADFTYDDATKRLCGRITYSGLSASPTGVKLQTTTADPGLDATPSPKPTASPFSISVTLSDSMQASLANGDVFINILTAAYPRADNGELNGALSEDGEGAECPTVADAGTDAGQHDASTGSSSGSSSSSSSSNDNDNSTTGGTDAGTQKTTDDGGCSTAGDLNAGSLALATIVGMATALMVRSRRRRR